MSDVSIFDEVQAALLNSECEPKRAVLQSLLATAQFAYLECDMSEDDVFNVLAEALVAGPKLDLW